MINGSEISEHIFMFLFFCFSVFIDDEVLQYNISKASWPWFISVYLFFFLPMFDDFLEDLMGNIVACLMYFLIFGNVLVLFASLFYYTMYKKLCLVFEAQLQTVLQMYYIYFVFKKN